MRALACGGLDDVPSAEQMEILPNLIIHWPQESVFPAIGESRARNMERKIGVRF